MRAAASENRCNASRRSDLPTDDQGPGTGLGSEPQAAADRQYAVMLEEQGLAEELEVVEAEAFDITSRQATDGRTAGATVWKDADASCADMDSASAAECPDLMEITWPAPHDGIYVKESHGVVEGGAPEASTLSLDQIQGRQKPSEADELQWQVPGHDVPVMAVSLAMLLVLGVATSACK